MAKPLRVSFSVLTCETSIFLTFEHPTRGVTSVLVGYADGWPTSVAVIGDRGAEQLEVLGDDYAEAVVKMVSEILARVGA